MSSEAVYRGVARILSMGGLARGACAKFVRPEVTPTYRKLIK